MSTADYLRRCSPVALEEGGGGMLAIVTCKACGTVEKWTIRDSLPPPAIILKHFVTRGWSLHRKPACPTCKSTTRKRRPMTAKPESVAATKAVAVLASDQTKAARREAHEHIAVYFDIAKGAYTNDYSDARIAKETGLSEAWVAQRREDEFGPLKNFEELEKVHATLRELTLKLDELQEQFVAINSRIIKAQQEAAEVLQRNGWAKP